MKSRKKERLILTCILLLVAVGVGCGLAVGGWAALAGGATALIQAAAMVQGGAFLLLGGVALWENRSCRQALSTYEELSVLRKTAERDALTGLYHRAAAQKRIDAVLGHSQDSGACHALLLLDIDHFKTVNDTYGHITGDQLLRRMGEVMGSRFRATDVLGRLGGDEFVVLLSGITSEEAAFQKAEEVCRAAQSIQASPQGGAASVSVGVALFPKDGGTFAQLYARADEALYRAKARGRNCAALWGEGVALSLPEEKDCSK